MTVSIAIYSDVICPWCLLGKRRLERALDELGLSARARLEWLPFELNPDMPHDGMARSDYRAAKFGAARAAELDRAMSQTGAAEGVTFRFDRMARTPNTRAAHVLTAFAGGRGRADALVEALFRAYFEEGRDIGDRDVLLELAAGVGLDTAEAAAALVDPQLRDEVSRLAREGRELGISGVPFFIVDRRWAVSGAQPSEQWVELLQSRVTRGAELEMPAA